MYDCAHTVSASWKHLLLDIYRKYNVSFVDGTLSSAESMMMLTLYEEETSQKMCLGAAIVMCKVNFLNAMFQRCQHDKHITVHRVRRHNEGFVLL